MNRNTTFTTRFSPEDGCWLCTASGYLGDQTTTGRGATPEEALAAAKESLGLVQEAIDGAERIKARKESYADAKTRP